MITFERCFDVELIRSVMTHPRIFDKITDDSSPRPGDYRPIAPDLVWYVLAKDVYPAGTNTLGLWIFVPQNGVCWEVHTALLPCAWGERGLEAARLLPDWVWEHTPCRRIVTSVPASNRLALHFAWKAGMRVYGVNEASWQKDGKLWDQVCLGISAPAAGRPAQAEEKMLVQEEV